jgi:hypothetical protein
MLNLRQQPNEGVKLAGNVLKLGAEPLDVPLVTGTRRRFEFDKLIADASQHLNSEILLE